MFPLRNFFVKALVLGIGKFRFGTFLVGIGGIDQVQDMTALFLLEIISNTIFLEQPRNKI